MGAALAGTSGISALTYAPGDNQTIYAGFNGGQVYVTQNHGVTWNAVLEGGGVLVSNKVKVEIDVQAALVAEGS